MLRIFGYDEDGGFAALGLLGKPSRVVSDHSRTGHDNPGAYNPNCDLTLSHDPCSVGPKT